MFFSVFFVLSIALLIETKTSFSDGFRQKTFFSPYWEGMQNALDQYEWLHNYVGLAVILLPPLLVVAAIFHWFGHWFFGMSGLVLSLIALLYSFGPQYTYRNRQVENECIDSYSEGFLAEKCELWFTVLFWFVVGGPLFALMCRFSRELAYDQLYIFPKLRRCAQFWYGLLNWLPARLMVISFAIVSDFKPVWAVIKRRFFVTRERVLEDHVQLLAQAAYSGIMNSNGSSEDEYSVKQLINSSLWLWIFVLAAIVLLEYV